MRSTAILQWIRRIHRWVGLVMALPLGIQGLTGCFLALAGAVTPFASHNPASAGIPAPPASVGAIIVAAQTAVPHPAAEPPLPIRYVTPLAAHEPAEVDFMADRGRVTAVWIDPADLQIRRVGPRDGGVVGSIRSLHTDLLLPTMGGRSLVGCSGIALLVVLVSGVPIWWPRRGRVRQAVTPDLRAQGWTFHRRLHGATGAWLGIMLLLLSVTGISMAFPSIPRGLLSVPTPPPRADRGAPTGRGAAITPDAIDMALRRGQAALPDALLRVVFLPATARAPMRLLFADAQGGARTEVRVSDQHVSVIGEGTQGNGGMRILRWIHDIHTGNGYGPIWHLLTALAGAGLVLLPCTGWLMWLRARSARRRVRLPMAARPAAPEA